jgi:hypothetical protein
VGNVFCSKSLDTTSGTAVANEATTFLLHILISDGGGSFCFEDTSLARAGLYRVSHVR